MLSFRRRDIGPEVVRKLRRGVWALQGELDLHGLRRDEARERVAAFLRDAAARRAALRARRPRQGQRLAGARAGAEGQGASWLVQRSEVLAFTQARPPTAAMAR